MVLRIFHERRRRMKYNWFKRIWYRINPKHKDRLFCTIFGKEKYKRYALELYNAINDSHYEDAVDEAVKWCIENGILVDVLEEERSAVMLEMLTEFDEKTYEEGLREEGREEGRKEGHEEGRKEERINTEKERRRADKAEAELVRYRSKYGKL